MASPLARGGLTESRRTLFQNILDALYPRAPASPLTCDVCYFLFSLPPLRCVLPTGVRLAPRFQCGGRDRGAAASLRRLWQTLRSRVWQALGTTELGQYFASRFCEDQTKKVCDRGSWPPAPHFNVGGMGWSIFGVARSASQQPQSTLKWGVRGVRTRWNNFMPWIFPL